MTTMMTTTDTGLEHRLPEAGAQYPIWIRVGILLDGGNGAPLRNAHLVYDTEAIRYVGVAAPPAGCVRSDQRAPDADLSDCTALPGLIDAHAHLFLAGGASDAEARESMQRLSRDAMLQAAMRRLDPLVRLGVTGIRDAGDKHGVGLALSALRKTADRPRMPYVDSPGAAIHRRGRYGRFMSEPIEDHDSLETCVAHRIRSQADRIKLICSGIIDFKCGRVTGAPQMSVEDVKRLVNEARRYHRQTFAHATGDEGIERAIEGGVDSIEHGFFIRNDQLARMRDRDIAWVPTFAPVQKQVEHADRVGWDADTVDGLQRILEAHGQALQRAVALGVRIVAGSDAGSYGVPHGLGTLYELEQMERAGMSPLQIVHAATGAGAERFAYAEPIGRLAVGYRSRFLLTTHDPLEGVSNLGKSKTVVFDGEVLSAAGAETTEGL